jgi:hypothetical protein
VETIFPFAEIAIGAACLVLVFFLFGPLKRFASHPRNPKPVASIAVLDELLVIGWLMIAVFGIALISDGLIS